MIFHSTRTITRSESCFHLHRPFNADDDDTFDHTRGRIYSTLMYRKCFSASIMRRRKLAAAAALGISAELPTPFGRENIFRHSVCVCPAYYPCLRRSECNVRCTKSVRIRFWCIRRNFRPSPANDVTTTMILARAQNSPELRRRESVILLDFETSLGKTQEVVYRERKPSSFTDSSVHD